MGKKNKFDFNNIKFNSRSSRSDRPEKKGRRKKWMYISIILVAVLVVSAIVTAVIINARRNEHGRQVSQVAISSLPTKLEYYVDEQPSYTGLTITTLLNNGTSFAEGPEACTFSGFDSRFAVSRQDIYVTYGEHIFVFSITIKERPRPFSPLTKISLETLPKTEYVAGDWLNVDDGVLLLEYENGSTRRIRLEPYMIYGFSAKNEGTFTITVKLREDGYLATCTYEITVVAPPQNE